MNTCGTCKYFGSATNSISSYDMGDYKICGLIGFIDYSDLADGDEIAHVTDGSGYYAALCVQEDFGCNQWTAKEPPCDSAT